MKSVLIAILIAFTASCSSSNNTSGGTGTPLPGTWSITGNISSQSGSHTYQVVLVSSPCSVTSPVGTFSVQGPVCFIANSNSGLGSITGAGVSATGQGVLVGVSANPVPTGGSFNLVFVAGNASGNFVEFTGSGTVTSGALTGTGSCSSSTPMCQGISAAFSGTLQ